MKNLKRFIVLAIVFFLVFTATAYASHSTVKKSTPAFYGDVYVFYDNAPLLWTLMNGKVQGGYYEVQVKSVVLMNKGEVIETNITIPYQHSRICIYYKGHLHYFYLHPCLIGNNFMMFTFTGDG